MTLHLSHIGFTEGLTFISNSFFHSRDPFFKRTAVSNDIILFVYDLLRQVILPFVKSYGLISSFTESPSIMRI